MFGLGNEISTKYDPNNLNDQRWMNQQLDQSIRSGHDHINPSLDLVKTPPLSGWQQQISDIIVSRHDVFAGVPPAAGKTAPLRNAWATQFMDALSRGIDKKSTDFPRILYIAKTKQLALEAIQQNFQNWIYELFVYNPLADKNHLRQPAQRNLIEVVKLFKIFNVDVTITNGQIFLNRNQQNQFMQLTNSLTALRLGGISPSEVLSPFFYFKPIIVTTPIITPVKAIDPVQRLNSALDDYLYDYSQVTDLVKHYGKYFSIICIDEFQQYMPLPGKDASYGKFTPDSEKHFDMVMKILKYAPPPGKCGIALLTGTVNKETAKQLIYLVNSELKRDFVPKIFSGFVENPNDKSKPEFVGNRSTLTVVPFEKMATPEERLNLVTNIVNSKQTRSIMIIFSTRRTAVTGIFNLLSQAIRKLPARDPKSLHSAPFKKEMPIQDFVKKMGEDENYISGKYNANMYPSGLVNNPKHEVDDIEYLQFFDVNAAEQQGNDDIPLPLLPHKNPNNLLYQGVLRGIGVMVGKMDNRMKAIIVKLFRAEKIYLLLATDSLGIGANTLCRHIYLPNLEKPDSNGFASIDDSSLVQLYNRSGRDVGVIPNAFIYCSLKDFPRIDKAVKSKPEEFVSEIPFDQMANRLKNKNSLMRSLFNELY